MNKCAVIVSGGSIDHSFALKIIKEKDPQYLIAVDRGLEFFRCSQIMPTHIVGDFDSVKKETVDYYRTVENILIREFNPVKDATDTEIAIRLAIEHGAEAIWILGATGTRLDHVMGNIQSLKIAHDAGVECYILDNYNRISLIEKEKHLTKKEAFGKYFSIFPLGGIVKNLSIEGAKYPLKEHTLMPYDSLCVSNQFEEEKVRITFSEGLIVLMETRDACE